jgi:gliding motility-associated-like protein
MEKVLLTLAFVVGTVLAYCQSVPHLSTNNDTAICAGQPIVLKAHLSNYPATTENYTAQSIAYSPDSYTAGTTVQLNDDDQSKLLPIGFNFCFYDNVYSQFIIASNGWVGFTSGNPNTWSGNTVPNSSGLVPVNCIMAPWQDLDPRWNGQIAYTVYGTAPYRRLVISYFNIPLFMSGQNGCGVYYTGQVKLFETTNVIETHILNKPACTSWNNGAATHALHNLNGSNAFVVNNRNSNLWTTTNEAYAFTPAGSVNSTINWMVNNQVVAVGNNVVYTPTSSGNISCLVFFGCGSPVVDSTHFHVTVSNPQAVISNPNSITCNGISNGSLQASVSNGISPYSYIWSNAQATATINNLKAGIYSVTISDVIGCKTTAAFSLVEPLPLQATAATTTPSCSYSSNGEIDLTVSGGTSPYNYHWSNSSTNQDVSSLANGSYQVTIMDKNNCSTVYTTTLMTRPLEVNAGVDMQIFAGQQINLEATISAAHSITYNWWPETNVANPHAAKTFAAPRNTTAYTISIIDSRGCLAKDEIIVTVNILKEIPLYNAFTPNHDGQNELFTLKVYKDIIDLVKLRIYNRFGQEIFNTSDIETGWDGTFNGVDQEIGTYVYEIAFKDAEGVLHVTKGDVSLLR